MELKDTLLFLNPKLLKRNPLHGVERNIAEVPGDLLADLFSLSNPLHGVESPDALLLTSFKTAFMMNPLHGVESSSSSIQLPLANEGIHYMELKVLTVPPAPPMNDVIYESITWSWKYYFHAHTTPPRSTPCESITWSWKYILGWVAVNPEKYLESITWSWKTYYPVAYIASTGSSRESITWSWKIYC